jgi:microcystin-dependent protein
VAAPNTNTDYTLTLPTATTPLVGTDATQTLTNKTIGSTQITGFEGMVATFAMNTPPAGWLKANGAAVSRSTYAALFTAIGTTFGVGDGSTTFNLPDLRGEFMRGWDDGRGVDSGRAFGSAQADDFLSHTHSYTLPQGNTNTTNGSGNTLGSANFAITKTSGSTGGTETRPRNIALLACIKY